MLELPANVKLGVVSSLLLLLLLVLLYKYINNKVGIATIEHIAT